MKRGLLGTIMWTLLAACLGVGLFFVKHEVKDQERRLAGLNAEIQRNQETIHVLRAEWSYLNDPSKLKTLAEKHLGMHAVKPAEVATLDQVLKNGMPPAVMLAAATPPRAPAVLPPANAKPAEPAAPKHQVKLADNGPKPRPGDAAKPPPSKPQTPKPGAVTMARSEPPPPLAPPAPARSGGKTIVVKSPALAQSDGGSR